MAVGCFWFEVGPLVPALGVVHEQSLRKGIMRTMLLLAAIALYNFCAPLTPASAQGTAFTGTGIGQSNSAIADFDAWTTQFLSISNRAAISERIPEGITLAKQRRLAFAKLIKTDPERALALTVPKSVRQNLPRGIANELETGVSGIGDFSVLGLLPAQGGPPVEPIQRFANLNGQTYGAYVYGRRLGETCKRGIPLHGVALDGMMALHESALRQLEPDEAPEPFQRLVDLRPKSQKKSGASKPLLAEIGGTIYRFASPEQMQETEARLEAAETRSGPVPLEAPTAIINNSGSSRTEVTPLNSPTAWTTGGKNVLVIRVDFSDLPGDPGGYPASHVQDLADSEVSAYYLQSSYGLTRLTNTVTAQVYRMPSTAAYYATNNDNYGLHNDAETAASANYSLSTFDRIIVLFSSLGSIPGSQITYGGLSDIGGPHVWVNGEFDFRVVAHELGHTYGLFHANLWQVIDGNPISSGGTDQNGTFFGSSGDNYGDDFDTMGANFANSLATDFNPWFKNMLGWISDNQVQTIKTNGTYRIYAFDWANYAAAPVEPLALKVVKDATHNYWINCRRNFTNNVSMENGAYIIWGYNYNRQSDLLDLTTPGTNVADAALAVGAMFVDTNAQISIRPMAEGGTSPNEYLAVEVAFGMRPSSPADVLAWGNDVSGQINVPIDLTNAVAIAGGGNFSSALRADGTVSSWGDNSFGQTNVPMGLSNVVAIADGLTHTLALRADGIVIGWGDNSLGETNIPLGVTNVVAISAGVDHSLALKSDGTVVAWGSYAATNVPFNLSNVVAIAAGYWNSLALTSDGTVVAWGDNYWGQDNVPLGLSNVVAIAAGDKHSVALKSDGIVVAWGAGSIDTGSDPNYGQSIVPYGLSNVAAIAAGGYDTIALKADGTVVVWGYNADGETNVPATLTNVLAMAGGNNHILALVGCGLQNTSASLTNPGRSNNIFRVSVATVRGRGYVLEFRNSLRDGQWRMVTPVPGDGTVKTLIDSTASGPQRFYRVRQQW